MFYYTKESFPTKTFVFGADLAPLMSRSSRPEVFCKKFPLKNFAEFTGKTPALESLLNQVAGLQPTILLKRQANKGVFL